MINQFADHLRKSYKEEKDKLITTIAAGNLPSFEEYIRLTAVIHGLELAERELNELMLAYNKE